MSEGSADDDSVQRLQWTEFLVTRKFGTTARLGAEPKPGLDPQNIAAYRRELLELPADELRRRVAEASAQDQARADREDRERLPWHSADFDFWSKSPFWLIAEGSALLLAKDPNTFNWETVKAYRGISATVRRYKDLLDLATRARDVKILGEKTNPGYFLRWAERLDLDVPPELRAKVEARGNVIGDWQDAFEQKKAEANELRSALESARADLARQRAAIESKDQELTALRAELERLSNQGNLSGKARNTAHRLILGMAVARYKYDLQEQRSTSPGTIAADLNRVGIEITDETVREWLTSAAEALSYRPIGGGR